VEPEERHTEVSLPDFITEDILREFIAEANEGIQGLELDFIALEKSPNDAELLNKIFRVIHSIKGGASFIGFKNLENISHKTEDVLNKLRKAELQLTPCIMDILLNAVDIIKLILKDVEENRSDTHVNANDVILRLADILTTCKEVGAIIQEQGTPIKVPQKEEKAPQPPLTASASQSPTKEDIRSVRINIEKLDSLFNLVGELVLSRNRNLQIHRLLSNKYPEDEIINLDLLEAGSYLNRLTSEIQLAVMKTRMMPVSTVFNKFQRVVRDMAKNLGKELELFMSGEDTEIDKNIIEGIGDPLTHIIRNSVDHGIEMPGERQAEGKQRTGRIELKAYYEGNFVIIDIKDDGKGIDLEAVRKKAVEKGMISAQDVEKLSKNTLLNFIFAPGFSTAKNVTATSGRGVGMDVVRTNIEKLRGQIIIDSDYGVGTEIKLKIPLTLAILETMIVNVSDQRYAIPLSNIIDTHKMRYGEIETVRGSMVFRMRDEIIPLIPLSEIFNIPHKYSEDSEVTIVVLRHGISRMGLIVDKSSGQEEVVIKPIDCLDGFTELKGVSGATILGDGSITFILDVDALMKLSKVEERQLEAEITGNRENIDTNAINVVLVDNLGSEQYAIPAKNVKEIAIIQKAEIEEINGKLMTNYKGRIMPLTTISAVMNIYSQNGNNGNETYYMLILNGNGSGKETGILVERLLGIRKISEALLDKDKKILNGITGSAIFNNRITFLLDVEKVTMSEAVA